MKDLLKKYKGEVLLFGLVSYTIILGAGAIDQFFDLEWFPAALEKQLHQQIDLLDSPIPSVRDGARQELVKWGDFSVPHLIETLTQGSPQQREVSLQALHEIAGDTVKIENDPQAWRAWFKKYLEQFNEPPPVPQNQ